MVDGVARGWMMSFSPRAGAAIGVLGKAVTGMSRRAWTGRRQRSGTGTGEDSMTVEAEKAVEGESIRAYLGECSLGEDTRNQSESAIAYIDDG